MQDGAAGGLSVLQEKGIVLQLEYVMGRNCIAIPQSVLQEYAVAISVLQHGGRLKIVLQD